MVYLTNYDYVPLEILLRYGEVVQKVHVRIIRQPHDQILQKDVKHNVIGS